MAMNNGVRNDITVEIQEHIGVIATHENGWAKEVNIVSWNGMPAKLDIREWDVATHQRMTRGVTFNTEEASRLVELLKRRYG